MERFVVTKHERTGGWIIIPSIKEQLVYEMGDPREYITPDCVADFTTVQLEYEGRDRVRVYGIEGTAGDGVSESFDQLFRRVSRQWERWFTPGRMLTTKRRRLIGFCARVSIDWD